MPAKAIASKKDTPKYNDMIKVAINSIKGVKGVSRQAITKYIITNYGVKEGALANSHIRKALKSAVEKKELTQTGQRFKVTKKESSTKKPSTKKAAPKKTTASKAKAVSKAAPKKPTAKKSVAKKAATAKKATASKSAAKKTTPKKAAKGKTASK